MHLKKKKKNKVKLVLEFVLSAIKHLYNLQNCFESKNEGLNKLMALFNKLQFLHLTLACYTTLIFNVDLNKKMVILSFFFLQMYFQDCLVVSQCSFQK